MSDHHPHEAATPHPATTSPNPCVPPTQPQPRLLQRHPLNNISTLDTIRPACHAHPEPGATAQIVLDIFTDKKNRCSSHLNALNRAMHMFMDAYALNEWTRLLESFLRTR